MKRRFHLIFGLAITAGMAMWSTGALSVANVAGTKHNLSISGPGGVKSTSEIEVCIFCHVPHNASGAAPLWNRATPSGTYIPYASSTAKGNMGQPNGTSLLCLSCHDGTIALGELLSRGINKVPMQGVSPTGMLPSTSSSLLGRDLSDDHPISFAYSAALPNNELVSAASLTGKVKLDASGQMQCSSCHDPHDNTYDKFLVMNNTASALCMSCHTKTAWSTSSHSTSTATWSGSGSNPWPHSTGTTVAANACEGCHQPHTAAGKARLMNNSADEANCYVCHTGTVAGKTTPVKNMQSEATKISGHQVDSYSGLHDPVEANLSSNRHVACADCHNPHQTNASAGTTTVSTGFPTLPGALKGVKGVDIAGSAIAAVTYEYQLCFRCHGDSTGKKAPSITRAVLSSTAGENNVRKEFLTTNASFHPVAGTGKNTSVPSLISPLSVSSTFTCSACHSNNSGVEAGGTGPRGPHGSNISPLLERTYVTTDNSSYSASNYALCFKCHSATVVMSSSSWSLHNKHVSGEKTPCSVCHDPHGVSTNQHLINFDTAVVTGARAFLPTGINTRKGSCNLSCHGKSHGTGESY